MTHPTTPPDPVPKSFIGLQATAYGLDAGTISLRRDDEHRARHLDLDADGRMSIRIDLKYPETFERDRKGLRRLADLATQAAQEIERIQHGDGTEASAE